MKNIIVLSGFDTNEQLLYAIGLVPHAGNAFGNESVGPQPEEPRSFCFLYEGRHQLEHMMTLLQDKFGLHLIGPVVCWRKKAFGRKQAHDLGVPHDEEMDWHTFVLDDIKSVDLPKEGEKKCACCDSLGFMRFPITKYEEWYVYEDVIFPADPLTVFKEKHE